MSRYACFVYFVALAAVLFVGCGDLLQVVLEDDSALPVKDEAGLKKLGQQLAQALAAADYSAAYAMAARQLADRLSEEQFIAEVKNRWQLETEGGRPERFEIEPWMPAEDEFNEWEGMPKTIKYGQLAGIVQISFALELEGDEVVRSLTVDAVIVEEGGELKLAYLEFYEAD